MGPVTLKPSPDKFRSVFDCDMTSCTGLPVHLELLERATPKFLKARSVPFALFLSIEADFHELEKQGIIKPTKHSEWATRLVLVRKGKVHLCPCSDYFSTVSAALQKAAYSIPTAD